MITVFGGTGFLGRAVVRCLVRAGETVRVAARRPSRAAFAAFGDRIERVSADVRDDDAVAQALSGADAAVNAVSLYVERGELSFDAIHVDGAARVARAAAAAGVGALAHVSGIGADPRSTSRYVAARGRGESAVREAFPNATILRPSVLFGRDDAFLATLDAVTRLPVLPLFGRGSTRLQPVHVEDVAAAVGAAIERHSASAGRVFELGGAEVYTYREIVAMVLRHRRRCRALMPVPFSLWHAAAGVAGLLPNPPITRDQVILMSRDNVVSAGAESFASLDIEPASLAALLPTCLNGGG
ncbi:complex I NDUFA9 subunit family protein [Arhodomonas sp. AD133]|uniref:complex I NDUFA9 subunit family protein n=1 Tax=Arhodomonas sp. AD133 TaxID=3415009 RepID=UPI003EBF3FD0